jgi:surface antigen
MGLARLYAAELLRDGEPRRNDLAKGEASKPVGTACRLPDGSWMYGRRESS